MKKNIWIFNHYATKMFKEQGGRHYWFATELLKRGYKPTVFCASTFHNSKDKIDVRKEKFYIDKEGGVTFVFVKTSLYQGNRASRIKNMIMFYKNIFSASKKYSLLQEPPDMIIASSPHPLTMLAGLKIAKKYGIPCICEVRDLWPESIIAYGILKRTNILSKILYKGEKQIYKKADSIIMTWEGGAQYIVDQGWGNSIDLKKIVYISNGVMIDQFDSNSEKYYLRDSDLDDKKYKNIVYTGSIRRVNNIGFLLDVAKIIQKDKKAKIRFLIYGTGSEMEGLIARCKVEYIENVIFKGYVEKFFIPSVLKRASVNILHNSSTSLNKYGQSQNKFFEYLAAGKGIVQTYKTGYSICEKYGCGIVVESQSAESVSSVIIKLCEDDKANEILGRNARLTAFNHDFKKLTSKLVSLIEKK